MDSSPDALPRISVFIVSNVRLHREGLAALLHGRTSIDVLGIDNLLQACTAPRITASDVALLDAGSSSDSDRVRELRAVSSRLRIVAFGIHEDPSDVLACAAAGIDGYVPMDAAVDEMIAAIENAVRGELACSPRVAASLYQCIGHSRAAFGSPLTTRELQVADLMNRGCPTKEIAWRLGVTPCTAKNHIRNILRKLKVHRRGQAVAKLRTLIDGRFAAT
jgi:two-component system nitrate/nitrite response regulator NarL